MNDMNLEWTPYDVDLTRIIWNFGIAWTDTFYSIGDSGGIKFTEHIRINWNRRAVAPEEKKWLN